MNTELMILVACVSTLVATTSSLFAIPILLKLITQGMVKDLSRRMDTLGMESRWVVMWGPIWIISAVAGTLIVGCSLGMYPVSIAIAFLMLVAPRMILDDMVRRHKLLLEEQLAVASKGLADALRAQLALPRALQEVGEETPRPLGHELLRIVVQFNRGRPLDETLREAKQRLDIDGFTLMANALMVAEKRGGTIPRAMEKISRTLLENQRLDRKMQADTAAGRSSINTLAVFPVGFLIFMTFFDPDGTALLFTTLIGQVVLAFSGLAVFASLAWSNRILRIE